jgi:type IV secretory pathway VirB3-like protein
MTWTYAPTVPGVSYHACRNEIVFGIFVFSSSTSRIYDVLVCSMWAGGSRCAPSQVSADLCCRSTSPQLPV